MTTVGLVANAPLILDTATSARLSRTRTHFTLNKGFTTETLGSMDDTEVSVEEPRDTAFLERSPTLSPQLNYIPPGLKCDVTTISGGQLTVCAIGRFAIGHVWGPYLVHLSEECKQSLRSLGEQSPNKFVKIAVKNSNCVIDETTIVLGEEHTWIKLLHESGTRMNEQESNVDLVVDLSAKTITLIVTKELSPNDMLFGTLTIRSSQSISMGSSDGGTELGQHQLVANTPNNTKNNHAPVFQSATTSPGCTGGPKRDKKCSYCGIPFSNVDTLTAHMTHYCSRRPKVTPNQHIAPSCSAAVTDIAAPCMTAATADGGVDSVTTSKSSHNNTAHRSVNAKRPASRVGTLPAGLDVPAGISLSNCFPPLQMFTSSSTDHNLTQLSDSLGNSTIPAPILSTFVLNSLGQLNSDWIKGGTQATTLLPFLHKISAAPFSGTIQAPSSKRTENSIQPTETRSPEQKSSSTPVTSGQFSKEGLENQVELSTETDVPSKTGQNSLLPEARVTEPIYCPGCQRYFASTYLHTCHLQMSARLLIPGNTVDVDDSDQSNNEGAFQSVASASARLGLVLTAPLFTTTGLQFVPVHPACGLLYKHRGDSKVPHSSTSKNASVPRHELRNRQSDHSSSHQEINVQFPLNVLDLSCTSNPEGVTESRIHSPGNVKQAPVNSVNSHPSLTNGCSDKKSGFVPSNTATTSTMRAQASHGETYPTLIQLFTQLFGTYDTNVERNTFSDLSGPIDAFMAQSPNPLSQLMAQLYLATLPSDIQQRLQPLDALQKSPDRSFRTESSSQISQPAFNCGQLVPNVIPAKGVPGDSRQTLSELFPAVALLNSIYTGTNYGNLITGTALAGTQNSKHTTSQQLGQTGIDCPSSPAHSPPPQLAVQRPYLCTYCQTRFQAFTTFQAHQQYYCQARREVVRNTVGTSSQTPAGATSTDNPSLVPITTSPNGNSFSPGYSGPSKRRKIMPMSPNSLKEPSPCKTGIHITASSSNHSSASGSGDEADLGQIRTPPLNMKTEVLGSSPVRRGTSSNESDHTPELCGTSELRCMACGYVGQTTRGMKMHRRLHECYGTTFKESKATKKKSQHPEQNENASGISIEPSVYDRKEETLQTTTTTEDSVKAEPS